MYLVGENLFTFHAVGIGDGIEGCRANAGNNAIGFYEIFSVIGSDRHHVHFGVFGNGQFSLIVVFGIPVYHPLADGKLLVQYKGFFGAGGSNHETPGVSPHSISPHGKFDGFAIDNF